MRRITLWVLTTITALVLLFGYRTSTSGPATGATAAGTTGTSPSSSAAGSTGTTGTTGTAPATGSPGGTVVTGTTEQTRWGPVQVAITVAGGRITAVDVPQYPSGNHKDQEINADAIPTLVDETLQAQSASIDMVSGATVTSTGYVDSLQSALDKAGIAA